MMAGFGLLWIVIIAGVLYALFHALQQPGREGRSERSRSGDTAIDILKRRYARGEIDRDEYEGRLHDLVG